MSSQLASSVTRLLVLGGRVVPVPTLQDGSSQIHPGAFATHSALDHSTSQVVGVGHPGSAAL